MSVYFIHFLLLILGYLPYYFFPLNSILRIKCYRPSVSTLPHISCMFWVKMLIKKRKWISIANMLSKMKNIKTISCPEGTWIFYKVRSGRERANEPRDNSTDRVQKRINIYIYVKRMYDGCGISNSWIKAWWFMNWY